MHYLVLRHVKLGHVFLVDFHLFHQRLLQGFL
jgi:hypothetical protein